jgi:hypothetical protein
MQGGTDAPQVNALGTDASVPGMQPGGGADTPPDDGGASGSASAAAATSGGQAAVPSLAAVGTTQVQAASPGWGVRLGLIALGSVTPASLGVNSAALLAQMQNWGQPQPVSNPLAGTADQAVQQSAQAAMQQAAQQAARSRVGPKPTSGDGVDDVEWLMRSKAESGQPLRLGDLPVYGADGNSNAFQAMGQASKQIQTLGMFAGVGAAAGGVVVIGLYVGPAAVLEVMAHGFVFGAGLSAAEDVAAGVDTNVKEHGFDLGSWNFQLLVPSGEKAFNTGLVGAAVAPYMLVPGVREVLAGVFVLQSGSGAVNSVRQGNFATALVQGYVSLHMGRGFVRGLVPGRPGFETTSGKPSSILDSVPEVMPDSVARPKPSGLNVPWGEAGSRPFAEIPPAAGQARGAPPGWQSFLGGLRESAVSPSEPPGEPAPQNPTKIRPHEQQHELAPEEPPVTPPAPVEPGPPLAPPEAVPPAGPKPKGKGKGGFQKMAQRPQAQRAEAKLPDGFRNWEEVERARQGRPLGRGHTGRHQPVTLEESAALAEVLKNPLAGEPLDLELTRLGKTWPEPGWIKMQQIIRGVNIHYLYNPEMGAFDDFKFKD